MLSMSVLSPCMGWEQGVRLPLEQESGGSIRYLPVAHPADGRVGSQNSGVYLIVSEFLHQKLTENSFGFVPGCGGDPYGAS